MPHMEWIEIATGGLPPAGQSVLAAYQEGSDRWHTALAIYAPALFLEAQEPIAYPFGFDRDQETGKLFHKPGWWETPFGPTSYERLYQQVSHWTPIVADEHFTAPSNQ